MYIYIYIYHDGVFRHVHVHLQPACIVDLWCLCLGAWALQRISAANNKLLKSGGHAFLWPNQSFARTSQQIPKDRSELLSQRLQSDKTNPYRANWSFAIVHIGLKEIPYWDPDDEADPIISACTTDCGGAPRTVGIAWVGTSLPPRGQSERLSGAGLLQGPVWWILICADTVQAGRISSYKILIDLLKMIDIA